jgi:RNA polymerase sigma factor (sigma-70 family)
MESQLTTDFWGQDSDKALRYLYNKYVAALRYFSAKYVDDDATIEDVVQDAFLNLWEKRHEFKTENTIKAYLYKIVRSFSVDTIRRRNLLLIDFPCKCSIFKPTFNNSTNIGY